MMDPMMCDAKGQPLAYSDGRAVWVKFDDSVDEDPFNVGDRTGVVVEVPGPGSEWYGFPRVKFRGSRKANGHHVANKSLTVLRADAVPVEVDAQTVRKLRELASMVLENRHGNADADPKVSAAETLREMAELIEKL